MPRVGIKPVPFGDELAYLAVQLVNVLLLVVPCLFLFAAEGFWNHRQRLLFPEVDLGGMDTVFAGQLINRFLLADRLDGHFSFKFRCVVFAYICHSLVCLFG